MVADLNLAMCAPHRNVHDHDVQWHSRAATEWLSYGMFRSMLKHPKRVFNVVTHTFAFGVHETRPSAVQ